VGVMIRALIGPLPPEMFRHRSSHVYHILYRISHHYFTQLRNCNSQLDLLTMMMLVVLLLHLLMLGGLQVKCQNG